MNTLTTFAHYAGYLFAGLGFLVCAITPLILFAIFSHKHIPESTLSEWDKKGSL